MEIPILLVEEHLHWHKERCKREWNDVGKFKRYHSESDDEFRGQVLWDGQPQQQVVVRLTQTAHAYTSCEWSPSSQR